MTQAATSTGPDVLAEDRLLWEFWLNHGLEAVSLRERIRELPLAANGSYMVMNALYGGFEEGLLRSLAAQEVQGGCARAVVAMVARVVEAPAGRIDRASPEGQLLGLLSLWPAEGSDLARRAREAASRVTRWPALVRAAGRANLAACVAAGIRSAGLAEAVPAPWGRVLETAAAGIRSRSRRILPLVEELTKSLAERGVRCCLLKESALIGEEYPEPGQRLMGDVDILVAPEDLPAVAELMEARGHRPFEGIWSAQWYRRHHHHEAPQVSAAQATKVEPHTGIWIPGESGVPVSGEMIETARPHRAFRALRPEATFMCFHLLVDLHGGASLGKLGQISDLMKLLDEEGRQVDGSRLRDLGERTGSLSWLEDSVRLVASLHGRELLEERAPALRGLGSGRPPGAVRRLRLRLARDHVFGFEPRASALSVASVKLLHKSLMRPGGLLAAASFFFGALLAGGTGGSGAGEIARRSRGSLVGRLARLATFPFRATWRMVTRR